MIYKSTTDNDKYKMAWEPLYDIDTNTEELVPKEKQMLEFCAKEHSNNNSAKLRVQTENGTLHLKLRNGTSTTIYLAKANSDEIMAREHVTDLKKIRSEIQNLENKLHNAKIRTARQILQIAAHHPDNQHEVKNTSPNNKTGDMERGRGKDTKQTHVTDF
jgi:hypothetical protein